MKALNLDCFTSLDELKPKEHGDPVAVLGAIMKAGGRFSVFDATCTAKMARTMTFIEGQSGWVKRAGDCAYPWVEVELTDKGRAALPLSQRGEK